LATLESIRRVRIQYTSDGAEKAEADARGVAVAQEELGRSSEVVSIATERAARRQLSAAAAYERQKVALDSTLRAQQTYERQMRVIERAQEQATISADEAAASILRVREAYQAAGSPRGSFDQTDINRLLGVQAQVHGAAAQSAAVFEEAARETAQYQARASALRAQLDPLSAAQDRLNAEMAEYSALAARGIISTGELAGAHAMAITRFNQTRDAIDGVQKKTGLATHQWGNLAYQVNDVVTMLAMGAPPMMVLTSQGGQLYQILSTAPGGVGGALGEIATRAAGLAARFAPFIAIIGVAGAAVGALTASINETSKVTVSFMDVALGVFRVIGDGIYSFIRPALDWLAPYWEATWDWIKKDAASSFNMIVRGLNGMWEVFKAFLASLPPAFRLAAENAANFLVAGIEAGVNKSIELLNKLPGVALNAVSLGRVDIGGGDAQKQLDGILSGLQDRLGQINQTDYASQFMGAIGNAARDRATDRAMGNDAYKDIVGQAKERVASLEAEAAALDMTNGKAEAYRFTQELIAAAKAQDIELLPAQLEQLHELGEAYANAQLKLDGMRLTMENRGPFETLQQDLANLKEMVDAGAISWETYADAQRRATAEAHATVAGYASDVMGIMGQLFEDNKAVAIANAIVSTYEGVAKSLAKYPMPWAAVMAAAHLALGMKQVMAIKSTNKTSKSASGGGGGGGASPSAGAASGGSQEAVQRQAISIALYGDTVKAESIEEMVKKINQNTVDGGTPLITIQRMAS